MNVNSPQPQYQRFTKRFFGIRASLVIMRYLKKTDPRQGEAGNQTIETFVGTLPKEYLGADSIGTSEITGSFLPEKIFPT